MGQIIKATCSICKYENKFNFGGARYSHGVKPVPALNIKTGAFENINYHTHKDNATYIFYSHTLLKSHAVDLDTIQNADFMINKFNNYCPSCKEFTLDFECIAFFD
jgi:hypothetical protein